MYSLIACCPMRTFSSEGAPGNILRGVSSREVKARIRQARIQILRLLEVFDRRVELAALIGLNALVEKVAGFQLVAAAVTATNAARSSMRAYRLRGLRSIPISP